MPPTVQEMLKHHNEVNAQIQSNMEVVTKRQVEPSKPGEPVTVESLTDPTADPFGGNVNNRRVAKRIALEKRRVYLNHSMPSHLGDPDKARKDIALSEKLNPEVDLSADDEKMPEIKLPPTPPTPGSPAAKKAAAAQSAAPAPPWQDS